MRGVMHSCIPLVIEEQHSETRIDRGLIRIGEGSVNLIQTEAGHERRLVRNLVVHADGELVGPRYDFRRSRVGPIAKGSVRLVRLGIPIEHRHNRRVSRDGQRVSREARGIDALPLRRRRRPGLPESCPVLAEILDTHRSRTCGYARHRSGAYNRSPIGEPKLISLERRNAAVSSRIFVIEIIASVERGIAQELEHAPVDMTDSRFRHNVGVTRCTMPRPPQALLRSSIAPPEWRRR